MQPLDKSKDNAHRYCCSNPNCKKVFSKPKIIKYYVCPSCQELVDLPLGNFQLIAQEKPAPKEKQVSLRKHKESKHDKKQEPKEITVQQAITNNELTSQKKPDVKEILETIEPAQTEDLIEKEILLNKNSGTLNSMNEMPFSLRLEDENQETVKKQKDEPSDACPYYFGYLCQRSKEEVIPETCFGCLKSIECMLSKHVESPESAQEIKKWYSFKL